MKRIETAAWLVGSGTAAILAVCLGALLATGQGMLFNPGPLSAEHVSTSAIARVTSHADFEKQCDQCHTPFSGPDAGLCVKCHRDVGGQVSANEGIHGGLANAQACSACHPDHRGRTAGLTSASVTELPHNQFGFTLAYHQRDYAGNNLSCRSCHQAQVAQSDKLAVRQTCIECHTGADTEFVADHRKKMGDACMACHDGTDRLRGFNHDKVYALTLKHAALACTRCHVNDQYKGTPRNCIQCHPDSQTHKGQFGNDCSACHTTAGWRPARLIKHNLPLAHGNQGKDSACLVCHPSNYGAYTCYTCHDHNETNVKNEHIRWNKWDVDCMRCHPTGKRIE